MTDSNRTGLADGWFVVWTSPRSEKRVESRMATQGFDAWLPTITERHRWSDRWRDVILPLFPGYLFARGTVAQLPSVLRTPGVLTVVKHGGRPALLSDGFIASLRRGVDASDASACRIDEPVEFGVNDEVVVREGPLTGLRGVIRDLRTGRRIVVWIEEMGRGVAFTIGTALVSPVRPRDNAYSAR